MEKNEKYVGRCMKCKKQQEMKDVKIVEIKKNTNAAKGTCVVCGCKMFKILGKKK